MSEQEEVIGKLAEHAAPAVDRNQSVTEMGIRIEPLTGEMGSRSMARGQEPRTPAGIAS